MDKKSRRSSILKVRQPVDLLDETAAASSATNAVMNRRVSFHNVKHVKQYDREHGQLIEESPLREKIADTLDSDGILTPRGRSVNVSYHNETLVDMSLETVVAEDDTMKMFDTIHENEPGQKENEHQFAVPQLPNSTINQSVLMELDESERASDTMNMFNPPANVSMDISSYTQSATKVFSDDDMDVTSSRIHHEDTMKMFETPKKANESMELTLMEETPTRKTSDDMDISMTPSRIQKAPSAKNAPEDTMMMFQSPNQKASDDMDISMTPSRIQKAPGVQSAAEETMIMFQSPTEKAADDMDISMTPSRVQKTPKTQDASEETIAMFQSPIQNQKSSDDMEISVTPARTLQITPKAQNAQNAPDDMDISMTPIQKTSKIQKTSDDVDMEMTLLEKTLDQNETRQLFKSPARIQKTVIEESEHSIAVNAPESPTVEASEIVAEIDRDESSMMITEQPSAMDLTDDIDHKTMDENQKTLTPQKTMRIDMETSEFRNTINNTSEIQKTPQQMNLCSGPSTPGHQKLVQKTLTPKQEPDSPQKTMRVDSETSELQKTFNETCEMSISRSRLSISFNTSITSIRRRRSIQKRESPRRLAMENSMITMSMAPEQMSALGEYRRREMLQTSQQHLLNCTNLADTSRDIFKMNTSFRSSPHTFSKQKSNELVEPLKLPEFDAAVANVFWLTSDDTGALVPEVEHFQSLLEHEAQKTKALIQNQNAPNSLSNHDEQEVLLVSRELAEQRFLELRLKFAKEQTYDLQIQKIQLENAHMASSLLDLEDEHQLLGELEQLEKQKVLANADQIRAEWREKKRAESEQRVEAISGVVELMLQMNQEKLAMKREMEELMERISQLEDAEAKFKEQFVEEINANVPN